MNDILNLEPKEIWNYFYQITQIPHPSHKEEKIIKYIKDFGEEHNLETFIDEVGNIIIRKPATIGMENRKGVIFQTHLDMVPQKNNDKVHDFENDPLEIYIDGEWVKAKGTTLGSDNGIGVAAVMAVLVSNEIHHGPVEALFTINEEAGMTGAFGLKPGLLKGDILMNLDTENDEELYVGCAGAINVNAKKNYVQENSPKGMKAYKIVLKGLKGGHSGLDIALGRANSNKLLFRFLMQTEHEFGIRISEAGGGDMRNAIPRESYAVILVPEIKAVEFEEFVENSEKIFKSEFAETEPDMAFVFEKAKIPEKVMHESDQYRIIRALFVCPNGIQRMSQSIKDLVETSNNLAIVKCRNGIFEAFNLTRSSVESAEEETAWSIAGLFQLINAEVTMDGKYQGWKPDMMSPILKTMSSVYRDIFGNVPEIKAVHAGLECGILGGIYPNLDMIAFGPTIRSPHSPDERVLISSVKKFWDFMVGTLKEIPVKN